MSNSVFKHFYEIMQIPRESGNEQGMVEFLKNFATSHSFDYVADDFKNILIKKNTSNKAPLILQAHTDMVCVCEKNKVIDFSKDPITPLKEEDYLKADGTSLGADNGIGLCMILSLLEEDFPMNIEAVFTSEEETTMHGAQNFDAKLLKGKHYLNLDGSIESEIDIASASMTDTVFEMEESFLGQVKKNVFSLTVSGLIGGHSGEDIDKHRGHAFRILLDYLGLAQDFSFIKIDAKEKSNVIPTYAKVYFETAKTQKELDELLKEYYNKVSVSINAPKLKIELQRENDDGKMKTYLNSKKVFEFLKRLEYGVIEEDTDGTVLLSANLYNIDLVNSKIYMSVRAANKDIEKPYIYDQKLLAKSFEYKFKPLNYAPSFEYRAKSELRDIAVNTHKKVYGSEPVLKKIHAGLEAGVFAQKIPDLDICVIAPQIYDLHSTKERVIISSVDRTYDWLKEIVKQFQLKQ